jgi:hypothetical protein
VRRAQVGFALVSIVLGAAILIRTAVLGGSGLAIGYIFGVGLMALGAGRLYLARGSRG